MTEEYAISNQAAESLSQFKILVAKHHYNEGWEAG